MKLQLMLTAFRYTIINFNSQQHFWAKYQRSWRGGLSSLLYVVMPFCQNLAAIPDQLAKKTAPLLYCLVIFLTKEMFCWHSENINTVDTNIIT